MAKEALSKFLENEKKRFAVTSFKIELDSGFQLSLHFLSIPIFLKIISIFDLSAVPT